MSNARSAPRSRNGQAPAAEGADRNDLSREEILNVACGLIEQVGVDGFSMRKLAQELNRSTMATYRHVDNKDDLLVAAADSVLARVVLPEQGVGHWTVRFKQLAMAVWAEIEHARWIPAFLVGRQLATPHLTRILTELEAIMSESGLHADEAHKAVVMAWTFTIGLLSSSLEPGPYLEFGVDVIVAGLEGQHREATSKPSAHATPKSKAGRATARK